MACSRSAAMVCEDDSPAGCTKVECSPVTGECDTLLQLPEGTSCSDGNACTAGDGCDGAGMCVPGELKECKSGHPCRNSWCNENALEGTNPCVLGWKKPGVGCNDDDTCTESTVCIEDGEGDLKCLGKAVQCKDGNSCTSESCDPEVGCVFTVLEDGSACTVPYGPCELDGGCLDGKCHFEGLPCDDGVECTLDSCSEEGDCAHLPDDGLCDDGLFCTGTATCEPEYGCMAGDVPTIDDGNHHLGRQGQRLRRGGGQ